MNNIVHLIIQIIINSEYLLSSLLSLRIIKLIIMFININKS